MYDFWRWEYEYGHNLDPNAAIIVPGMALPAPTDRIQTVAQFWCLFYPRYWGWLFVAAGILMSFAAYKEFKTSRMSGVLKSMVV